MNSTKEAAREKFLESLDTRPTDYQLGAEEGFDAGYESARDQWTAVENGLPEPNQAVWVTRRVDYAVVPRTFESPYTPEDFVAVFSAWMPRQTEPQPYQQGGE